MPARVISWSVFGVCCFALVGVCSGVSTCGNFAIEAGEDCDDGNNAAGDGCSALCRFEDPCACASGSVFTCTTVRGVEYNINSTVCCPTRIHPVTQSAQCNCRGENALPVWPTPLAFADADTCELRDVNECANKDAHCALLAECINLDGSAVTEQAFIAAGRNGANLGYQCRCHAPLIGDGYTSCVAQQFVAEAILEVSNASASNPFFLSVEDAARTATTFVNNVMQTTNAIANVNLSSTPVSAYYVHDLKSAYVSKTGARALKQASGSNIIVFAFQSSDWDTLQVLTQNLNTASLAAFLQQQTQNLNVFSVLQSVTAVVDDMPSSYTEAVASSPGFSVDNITLASLPGAGERWQIDAHYYTPAGVSTLFFIRPTVQNKGVMDEPCVRQPDVCCLRQFSSKNIMSPTFRSTVSSSLSLWCTSSGALTTNGLAKPAAELLSPVLQGKTSNRWITDAMDTQGLSGSSILEVAPGQLQLQISYDDILNKLSAVSTQTDNSSTYSFDLGVLFFSAADTTSPRMFTAVSWTRVDVHVASSLTFAYASEQSFSFLQSVDPVAIEVMLLPEGSDANAVPQHLQYLHVSFRMPTSLRDAVVPGTSVQWALGTSPNDLADPALLSWTNACYSGDTPASQDGSGLWDVADVSGVRQMLEQLQTLDCARQWTDLSWCKVYNVSDSGALYYIDIPLGENMVPAVSSTQTHYLFLRFIVEASRVDAADGYERFRVLSPLSLQMELDTSRLMVLCEGTQQSAVRDTDFVRATLNIGVDLRNIQQSPQQVSLSSTGISVLDSSIAYQAVSVIDSIMTLTLQGSPLFFDQNAHMSFTVRLDSAIIVHTRDEQKHDMLMQITQSSEAMREYVDEAGFKVLTPTTAFQQVCTNGLSMQLDCAIKTIVSRGVPTSEGVVHEIEQDNDKNLLWLLLFFGDSVYMRNLALDFTNRAQATFMLNPRYRRAWWISPAYAWPDAQASDIRDGAIVFVSFSVTH